MSGVGGVEDALIHFFPFNVLFCVGDSLVFEFYSTGFLA